MIRGFSMILQNIMKNPLILLICGLYSHSNDDNETYKTH
jgi:hypothetical protein